MPTTGFIRLGQGGSVSFKDGVATSSLLPIDGNNIGDVRPVVDTSTLWMWSGSAWVNTDTGGGGGAVTSVNGLTGAVVITASTIGGLLPIANGGTNATTVAAAFNNLSPMTTNGDLIYRAAGTASRLPIGGVGQVLTVSAGGLPVWQNSSSLSFPLLAPDGSVSAPSYSFSSATNTGMYVPSVGNLGLTVLGSEIINISASGTVLNSGLSVQSKTVTTNYAIL